MEQKQRNTVYLSSNYGNIKEYHTDYVVLENKTVCHLMNNSKIEELKDAVYGPHPYLFVRSRIEKSPKNICLFVGENNIEENIISHIISKGYTVKSLDPNSISSRKLARAYKESEFVICSKSESEEHQLLLCASGTPFLFVNSILYPVTKDFLRLSNLEELNVQGIDYDNFCEIFYNSDNIAELVERTF